MADAKPAAAPALQRHVLLLRGVNVGKGNRVPMAALRSLLEGLGFSAVRTLLNSGNAVFDGPSASAPALAVSIHDALQAEVGIDVRTIVVAAPTFERIVGDNELAGSVADPSRLLVAFAQDAASVQALAALAPLVHADERLHIGRHAAYLLCSGGILESAAANAMLGKLGRTVTTRNWSTVLKLQQLLR